MTLNIISYLLCISILSLAVGVQLSSSSNFQQYNNIKNAIYKLENSVKNSLEKIETLSKKIDTNNKVIHEKISGIGNKSGILEGHITHMSESIGKIYEKVKGVSGNETALIDSSLSSKPLVISAAQSANQQWEITFIGTDIEGPVVKIVSILTRKGIDNRENKGTDGNPIQQWYTGSIHHQPQRWVIVHKGWHFLIKHAQTRKCISVAHGSLTEAKLVLWSCEGQEHTYWHYENGLLINKKSGKCIAPPGNTYENHIQLQQSTCATAYNIV